MGYAKLIAYKYLAESSSLEYTLCCMIQSKAMKATRSWNRQPYGLSRCTCRRSGVPRHTGAPKRINHIRGAPA